MENLSVFVEVVKDYLAKENISLNTFAKKIDVTERAVSKWMSNDYFPTIKSSVKVADIIDCSISYLFGLSDTPDYKKTVNSYKFIDRFVYLCEIKAVTPYKVAKNCNFGQSMISKWKRGKYPKTETVIVLAKFFNCSMDYLIGRTDLN